MGIEVKFVPVENPEEKTPLGIPRRTWEDNIKMNLKEIGREIDSSGSGYGQVPRLFEQSNFSFRFHRVQRISLPAEKLSTLKEDLLRFVFRIQVASHAASTTHIVHYIELIILDI